MPRTTGVLLDTDIGDDIDDAWALAVCLHHPEMDLLGVTTVYGPTRIRAGLARWLVEVSGKKVEVCAGLSGPQKDDGRFPVYWSAVPETERGRLLEGRTDPISFLREKIRSCTYEDVVLLTVGALTNAAALFQSGAEETKRVRRVVSMVGVIADRPQPEYNAGCDPKATQTLFSSGKDVTMIGLDVTLRCRLSEAEMETYTRSQDPLIQRLMAMTRVWQDVHRRGHGTRPMPVLHDVLAALVVVEPELVTLKPMSIEVDDAGRTLSTAGEPKVLVAVDVNERQFFKRVREVLMAS